MDQTEVPGKSLVHEQEITLNILNVIDSDSTVSQRKLAKEVGIALGLVNSYVKRCVRKGWIKVTEAPANRYFYYLTPGGFTEKGRLTKEYLAQSFLFFRQSRQQCEEMFHQCATNNWRRLVIYGYGELAEIAVLVSREISGKLIAVVDPNTDQTKLAGISVYNSMKNVRRIDAVILCDLNNPQACFDDLCEQFPSDRIVVPPLLNVTLHRGAPSEDTATP